ncbi:MAG: peptide chain release factor N(5)-glutamine methyltransferase [Candidatus Eisenbacteria bacterium]|nr:peptide chain release factor N(5)-glutamine methyltransferase [Candidatus Eisenbacteria bacterium]
MSDWTVQRLTEWSRDYLSEKGFENARLEVELLLADTLGVSRLELYLDFDRPLSGDELGRYKKRLKRRLNHEPVQYITGTAAFMLSEFDVTPDVLIPRPETEALTEVALELLSGMAVERPDAADVGTGSGVIAVTLAQKCPEARVVATDSSTAALTVARGNAARAGVGERVEFLEGDLLEPLVRDGLGGRLSLIVSNPPYIPTAELDGLPEEVADFEPRSALDGGEDGLDCLRVLAQDGPGLLTEGGAIVLEVGYGQAGAVAELMRDSVSGVDVRNDYAGRERIVVGTTR